MPSQVYVILRRREAPSRRTQRVDAAPWSALREFRHHLAREAAQMLERAADIDHHDIVDAAGLEPLQPRDDLLRRADQRIAFGCLVHLLAREETARPA